MFGCHEKQMSEKISWKIWAKLKKLNKNRK